MSAARGVPGGHAARSRANAGLLFCRFATRLPGFPPHAPQCCGGGGGFDRLLLPTGKEAGDDADENSPLDDHRALADAGRSVPAKPVELATATKRDSVVRAAPFCVNVLSEAEIQRLNIPIIEDRSLSVPGPSIQGVIALRGVFSRQIARDQPGSCWSVGMRAHRRAVWAWTSGWQSKLPSGLRETNETEQMTHELHLVSDEGGDVRWFVGAFYVSAERDDSRTLPISLHESSGTCSTHPRCNACSHRGAVADRAPCLGTQLHWSCLAIQRRWRWRTGPGPPLRDDECEHLPGVPGNHQRGQVA